MSKKTKLMSKLTGPDANQEFVNKVFSAMDEAHENGHATIDEDGELLQFAEVDDDIIVEDQVNDNELTRISSNPDDENDFVLREEIVPKEAPTEAPTEEVKTESENLESIMIERIPGKDGEHAEDILPDYQVEIIPGKGTENDPVTAEYSIKFKNYSKSKADRVAKLFTECVGCLEGIVKDAKVDEDVQVKFDEKGEMKVMSLHIGKGVKTFSEELSEDADLTEVINKVNELTEKVEGEMTKEVAEEVKEECDKVMSMIDDLERKNVNMCALKSLVKKYSSDAAEELDKEDPTEAPTEESKDFSDPTVTLTIENLEPASVSQLLNGPGGEEKDPEYPSKETAPEVSPNAGEQGRQFSLKEKQTYNNPLLDTIWK